jgi:hypothetical protein
MMLGGRIAASAGPCSLWAGLASAPRLSQSTSQALISRERCGCSRLAGRHPGRPETTRTACDWPHGHANPVDDVRRYFRAGTTMVKNRPSFPAAA